MVYSELKNPNPLNIQEFVDKFETCTRHLFQNMWKSCSQDEKSLLMLMSLSAVNGRLHKSKRFNLSGIDIVFTQRQFDLTNLREKGLIIRKDNKDNNEIGYAFTSSIMERLVIQEVWNTDDPTLKGREKVFLNLISHKQVKTVTTAMEWLWKNKNQVPDMFVWLEKIVNGIQGII